MRVTFFLLIFPLHILAIASQDLSHTISLRISNPHGPCYCATVNRIPNPRERPQFSYGPSPEKTDKTPSQDIKNLEPHTPADRKALNDKGEEQVKCLDYCIYLHTTALQHKRHPGSIWIGRWNAGVWDFDTHASSPRSTPALEKHDHASKSKSLKAPQASDPDTKNAEMEPAQQKAKATDASRKGKNRKKWKPILVPLWSHPGVDLDRGRHSRHHGSNGRIDGLGSRLRDARRKMYDAEWARRKRRNRDRAGF